MYLSCVANSCLFGDTYVDRACSYSSVHYYYYSCCHMNTVILILLNSSFLFCSLLSSEPGLCMVASYA